MQCGNNDDFTNSQQANILYRTLFKSKTEQNYVYSKNSIIPPSLDDIDAMVTPITNPATTTDYNIYDYPAKSIKAMSCNIIPQM